MMANFMFYIGTHSIGTCVNLLHINIIIIITINIHTIIQYPPTPPHCLGLLPNVLGNCDTTVMVKSWIL